MGLSKEDKFIIETIARYTLFNKLEKKGVINKETFRNYLNNLSKAAKHVVDYYVVTGTEMIMDLSKEFEGKTKT